VNLALWIVQVLLALSFSWAGVMKVFTYEKAKATLPWVKDVSRGLVLFIGISDLAGGLGIALPWATGILPILTPIAACGIVLMMILAGGFHAQRKEPIGIASNVVFGAMAVFVAWGRF
jgi:uncharacterized membrane protein YphA (DoxX/SURF4 family)